MGVSRKSARDFAPVAATASDAGRLTGKEWHPHAVFVADVLSKALMSQRGLPLEVKVTLAACIVGALARIDTPFGPGDPEAFDRALKIAHPIEPLHPFLGDHEWRDIGPPETLYLLEHDVSKPIMRSTVEVVESLRKVLPGLNGQNAALGALFHLDRNFRHGVAYMVRDMVAKSTVPYGYVPGTVIGSPADQ
jgi:hypothetical protein